MDYSEYIAFRNNVLEWIDSRLKPSRFRHSLGVEQAAVMLAKRFGADPYEASIAALLHDNAKNLPIEKQTEICLKAYPKSKTKEFGLSSDYSSVLHAFAGAHEANKRYPELSEDICNAIRFHTTGRPGMSTLEKIIYSSDYVEPNRPDFPGLEQARKELLNDLTEGTLLILNQTSAYVIDKGKMLHPLTFKAIAYYHELNHTTEESKP